MNKLCKKKKGYKLLWKKCEKKKKKVVSCCKQLVQFHDKDAINMYTIHMKSNWISCLCYKVMQVVHNKL